MKKTLNRRWIIFSLVAVLGVYSFWVVFQVLRYSHPTDLSFRFPNEIVGVYHVHSHFSDGKKDVNAIAAAAAGCRLDFLILTDHGNPNLQSQQASGIKAGVLVLGGSELSLNRGHLVAMNIQPPFTPLSGTAEIASFQIEQKGGFSVIAHPYSKSRWSWGKENRYSGMEIINADSMLKSSFPGILPYLPILLFKPEVTAIKMLRYPRANLMKWDDINRRRPLYGYYAADAHMFYKALFSLLRLHVLLEKSLDSDFKTASAQIYTALSQGRFYSGIDGAADTSGFRFWAENPDGRIPMGSSAPLTSATRLHIELPAAQLCRVRLIHNGSVLPLQPEKHIQFKPENPGFYRVEVTLKKSLLSENCPWILSNPIYLKETFP
ncbi:MAG: hypothetical protein R6V02_06565 [Candidatus Aminicenantes bacterium]